MLPHAIRQTGWAGRLIDGQQNIDRWIDRYKFSQNNNMDSCGCFVYGLW